jgi:hypothetical protein
VRTEERYFVVIALFITAFCPQPCLLQRLSKERLYWTFVTKAWFSTCMRMSAKVWDFNFVMPCEAFVVSQMFTVWTAEY